MSLDSDLSNALTVRLNLQVSLSALPFVEEWMDVKLGEWLDSIPLPPESGGRPAQFTVSVGSDLSRLRWSASGSPMGFIPKLSEYLKRAKVSQEEIDRINEIGSALEPETIGSWIEVRDGAIYHGWQLLDREDASEVFKLLGDEAATMASAIASAGLTSCTRVAREIGSGYQLDFDLPGAPPTNALSAASPLLAALGSDLQVPEGEFTNRDVAPTRLVGVIGSAAPGPAGLSFGAASDQAASLASAVGATYDAALDEVSRSLGSEGVVGARVWGGTPPLIDVDFVPGIQRGAPRSAN